MKLHNGEWEKCGHQGKGPHAVSPRVHSYLGTGPLLECAGESQEARGHCWRALGVGAGDHEHLAFNPKGRVEGTRRWLFGCSRREFGGAAAQIDGSYNPEQRPRPFGTRDLFKKLEKSLFSWISP